MQKKLLQQVKKLSTIIFTDKEYTLFISSIVNKEYNTSLKCLEKIEDNLTESIEIEPENNELLISEYRKVDYLQKVVLEQSLKNNQYGKGIKFKQSSKRRKTKSI